MTRLSIGQVWDESRAFVRAERRLLVPLTLATLVLPATLLTLVVPPEAEGGTTAMSEPPPPGPWIIVALVMLAVMLIGQLSISRLALGWHGNLAEAIRHGLRRFLPMFLANLLLAAGMAVPLAFLMGVILVVTPEAWALAAVLLGIPLIMIFLRASLSLPVAAAEPIGPVAILRRAFAITKGSSWRLLGFALLFVLAAMIVAWAVSMIGDAIAIALLGKPEPWTVSATLMALLAGLIQGMIVTLWTVMLARIYAQLAGPVALAA